MTAKGVLRTMKNYTKGYSDIQMRVRDATSNDVGGPSTALMGQIAQATFNQHEFLEVMEMIDKRLNDKGKNWRHVFKALTVLDYCLHCGSDQVLQYSVDNIYVVKTLREFQHIDDSGRDQGANVRQKAREVTMLLLDPSKLRDERKNKNWMNDRMGFNDPGADMYGSQYGSQGSSQRPYNASRNMSRTGVRGGHGRQNSLSNPDYRYGDEDKDMRDAIAASKRESAHKNVPRGYDEDAELRRAIEESAKEAKDNEKKEKETKVKANGEVDLIGGLDDAFSPQPAQSVSPVNFNQQQQFMNQQQFGQQQQFMNQQQQFGQQPVSSAANDLLGAFGNGGLMDNSQFNNSMNANSGGAFDPFGLNNSAANQMGGMGGMNQMGNTINSMNGMNGMNGMSGMGQMSNTSPYGNNANQFVSQPNLATNLLDSSVGMGGANPFGQSTAALGMPSTSNAFSSMTQQTQSTNINSLGTNAFDGASGAFGNAFDGGNAAKPLPFGVNPSDANSRLAEIARNSDKIDPFASLALGSNTSAQANPFGSATNTTSSFAGMTGGSSLVDLSPAALTTSSSTQQFGQVSRNPFATGGSSAAMTPTGRQPSMNQLMSAGNQQSSMMAPQQNMGMGNMGMNNMGNMNMMGGGGFNAQPQQQQQQQHQFNPFAQQQQAPANQNNLFGL